MTFQVPYRSVQRVYFDDLDALNILHNVRFLLFMERARGELFNALGFHWEDDVDKNPDKFSVIAEHTIQYLSPVRGEGEIVVELVPTHLGSSSLVIEAKMVARHGALTYAKAATRMVRLDPKTQRPCPWTARFRGAIEPLLRTPEPSGRDVEK